MPVEAEIWQHLRKPGNRVLLISHKNPDGDTLGSMLAMYHALKRENIAAFPYCADTPSATYEYLPNVRDVTNDATAAIAFSPMVIVIFDSGDLHYTGAAELVNGLRERASKPTLIVIDHHYTNQRYGDVNLILPESSSTCEIVAGLLRAGSVPFSPEISQCVLTGVITDTGAFSNAATTKESLDLASHLLEGGAKLSTVLEHNFRNKKISTLKLWGKILGNLKETADGSVIAVISQADLVGAGNEDEGTEGLANFLQTLRDAKMIVVIKELPDGQLKGSLRTTRDDVDVSAIAKSYGGGGHKKAAGFTTKGELIIDEKSWRIE